MRRREREQVTDRARRQAARALWAALALMVLYLGSRLTELGSSTDLGVSRGMEGGGPTLHAWGHGLLGLITPLTVAVATVGLATASWRRSGRMAGAEIVLGVGGALGLAESLKALLPDASLQAVGRPFPGGSFPSGHVAVATALALAALSLATPRLRGSIVAPAVLSLAAVGVATVVVGWHRPSDALGGALAAVVAHQGLRARDHRGERVASAQEPRGEPVAAATPHAPPLPSSQDVHPR